MARGAGGGGGSMLSACIWWWDLAPRFEFTLLCILECRVSSSDRENFLLHPGKVQAWGFSPVWVRMCLVWCSRRWKALSHMVHL